MKIPGIAPIKFFTRQCRQYILNSILLAHFDYYANFTNCQQPSQ